MRTRPASRLADVAPRLEANLGRTQIRSAPAFAVGEIRVETVMVAMRDGVRLATDVYLPPKLPAPALAVRTPYGRAIDGFIGVFIAFARRGYVVVSQDCRGTGESEPASWDYYMFEPEDGYDFVDWVVRQAWFDGFLGAFGGSYLGQTQWQMAMHPRMSAIVPDVSGLGVAVNTLRLHMFANAYSRSVGKGADKVAVSAADLEAQILDETLATGFFNEPLHEPFSDSLLARFPTLRELPPTEAKRWLWERYCALGCAERAELVRSAMNVTNVRNVDVDRLSTIFGHRIAHDAHTLPHPRPAELLPSMQASIMLRTGWYDWGLNDALATWELIRRCAPERLRSRCRLLVAPSAHNMPGYHEGMAERPELQHAYGATANFNTLYDWFETARRDEIESWPAVIYYLMSANEWHVADDWPLPDARELSFYLDAGGTLTTTPPQGPADSDRYVYDPNDPTPTLGGSIVSYVYPPGSVDVSPLHGRKDLAVYTSAPLERDLDVVGPLRCVLYASSSAADTDFGVRLSDVFPDGRAIQLQNGFLRARYREPDGEPQLLEPGRIYRFEIDMWATANRFKAGHRLRIDVSSADFPRFDRHTNRAGEPGPPLCATQTIYRDRQHPSHLVLQVHDAPPPGVVGPITRRLRRAGLP